MRRRSPTRAQFLDDLIVTLIENFGQLPWFTTDDYHCPDDGPNSAVITDESGKTHPINRDVIAGGLATIRSSRLSDGPDPTTLHPDTGQPIGISPHHRTRILTADRDNEASEIDVIDASAIAEVALYGQVVYS